MKQSRFTEEQIIAILREQESGAKTADVCRRHGVSSATFYAWKAKFGGMEPSEARRLKALEDKGSLVRQAYRPVFEAALTYEPATGRIEVTGRARASVAYAAERRSLPFP